MGHSSFGENFSVILVSLLNRLGSSLRSSASSESGVYSDSDSSSFSSSNSPNSVGLVGICRVMTFCATKFLYVSELNRRTRKLFLILYLDKAIRFMIHSYSKRHSRGI